MASSFSLQTSNKSPRVAGMDGVEEKLQNELSNDVIENIFQRLPVLDLVRTKVLSSYWKSFAESLLASRFHKTPLLLLPPGDDNCFTNYSFGYTERWRLVNLQENMVYPLKKTTSNLLMKFPCIGSSYGWLILLDSRTLTPFLLNLFTEEKIELPSLKPLANPPTMSDEHATR